MDTLQHFDQELFLSQYWQKKPLLIKQGLADFKSPISADELAGLALEDEIESRMVLEHPGQTPAWSLRRGPFKEADFAQLPKTHWTLLVQGVDRFIPEVADLIDIFSFIPQWRFDDVMISYAVSQGGVGPHYDLYDVFLVQAQGRRRWSLTTKGCHEDNKVEQIPLRLMKEFATEQSFDLEPGDVLYLPPRVGHWGVSLTDDCMTYSFGYRSYPALEMLHSFVDFLEEKPNLGCYQDPNWFLLNNKGQISDAAIINAQNTFQSLINNKALFAEWFASFASHIDMQAQHLLPEPCSKKNKLSLDAFKKSLMNTSYLMRDRLVRMVYVVLEHDVLFFINGAQWPSAGIDLALIELLCADFKVPLHAQQELLLQDKHVEWLYTLWLAGYFDCVEQG